MQWFYSLKIGTKLMLSFVFTALIAAIIGIEGITSLQKVERASRGLYENRL